MFSNKIKINFVLIYSFFCFYLNKNKERIFLIFIFIFLPPNKFSQTGYKTTSVFQEKGIKKIIKEKKYFPFL